MTKSEEAKTGDLKEARSEIVRLLNTQKISAQALLNVLWYTLVYVLLCLAIRSLSLYHRFTMAKRMLRCMKLLRLRRKSSDCRKYDHVFGRNASLATIHTFSRNASQATIHTFSGVQHPVIHNSFHGHVTPLSRIQVENELAEILLSKEAEISVIYGNVTEITDSMEQVPILCWIRALEPTI